MGELRGGEDGSGRRGGVWERGRGRGDDGRSWRLGGGGGWELTSR